MNANEEIPVGTTTINPLVEPEPVVEPVPVAEPEKPAEPEAKKPDENIAKFEAMLKASQSMIGKQSSEIGALRAKLDEMTRQPAGPSEDEQLNALYQKMDTGEIDIAEGMRQALAINSNITASRVMNQLTQQQQQSKIAEVQGNFLKENPDYEQILASGALKPYLDADPLADEYTAFHKYKADERMNALQQEYEQKVLAAKEEGAKLAKGAEAAGKVLGKQGQTAMAPQVTRPFKNTQEATAAMMETLKAVRSASAQ